VDWRWLRNRVLKSKFGEMTYRGIWGKLHSEEFRNLYSSPNVIRVFKSRRMRWTVHVARIGEVRNACKILVGKPKGKRTLGRPRRRYKNNIIMNLGETEWEGVDWICLAQDRDQWRAVVDTEMSVGFRKRQRIC
jgi:hypothetical protein